MKNSMVGFTLLVFLTNNHFLYADKTIKKTTTNYSEMVILDKGVKRTVRVKKTENKNPTLHTTSMKKEVSDNKGIIIAFKKASHVDIKTLEEKYGLKLKKRLLTGYYIFNNLSDKSDDKVTQNIIQNEKGLKTVKPNWEKQNIPR
jgi:hypothetical protein